jgi:hypothetical protein
MQILENFKHADTFVQMTIGERVAATMYVIILGMGITFTALVLIWGMTAPAAAAVEVEAADQSELIAVISAAIAASMHTSMHNIVVTSIRRTGDSTPVWGQMGRSDVMNSRL